MSRRLSKILAVVLFLTTTLAWAEEAEFRLRDGAGRARVEANCVMCHSLDYIVMNSPIMDRKGWEASVNKMIKVMGAPITELDAQAIIGYLAAVYGKQ